MIFHLSFEIREILHFIAFIPLNGFYLAAAAICFPVFQPGLKFRFDYMGFFSGFSTRLPCLKILARFNGAGFSARAELRPGLGPSPCNRQFDFMRICSRNRAEISARLISLS